MKSNKSISLNLKTLIYLLVFSITILIFLAFSFNLFFKVSYEHHQEKKIKTLATSLIDYSHLEIITKLEQIVFENSVCANYVTSTATYRYNTLMVGCNLNQNSQIYELENTMIKSSKAINYIKLVDDTNNSKALLSGIKVANGYIFLYSPLEDVNSTSLFNGSLIFLTIGFIIISCLVSYFLSFKITKPITNITKQAKSLGEGKYNLELPSSGIKEIDELSNTLKHVGTDLSKIDELRRDLMANVSHDLKTPLTMIKAYAEMIKDISYKDKDKMTKDLDVIISETDRLTILVNDILELSKMQNEASKLKLEKFDLVELIQEIITKYEILKITENYQFILDLPSKALIKADKNKLAQVIYNLINNAINYTGDDKLVYVTLKKTKKEYILSIKDTGKGIDKEEIPYIWDKYYKKSKKHQRNVISTGLGLSIVKEILTKHHFDYGVESQKNKGTTFYFKIKI